MKKILFFAFCLMTILFVSCETKTQIELQPETPTASDKVETGNVSEITRSSAIFHGAVNVDISQYSNVQFGIMISTSKNEVEGRNGKSFDGKTLIGKDFKLEINDLSAGTKYYYCAWILLNAIQYEFGEIKEFTTLAAGVPTVETGLEPKIQITSAEITGEVKNDGGAIVTERGMVYSTSKQPTISQNKIPSGDGLGLFTCELTNLKENTTYYARAYAVNENGVAYGNELTFTTDKRMYERGYEYVDLGLSVKWATCNVGASQPEDYGYYFAWGETSQKSTYNWSTYKYCYGEAYSIYKYDYDDGKTQLEMSDDAARRNWGGTWRMPTYDELKELIYQCDWTWKTQNGVYGYKITGPNGNCIFLPAAGYRNESSLYDAEKNGYYRSSSLYRDCDAWFLDFYFYSSGGDAYMNNLTCRCYGMSVRPVF